jgi:hypothetical protein
MILGFTQLVFFALGLKALILLKHVLEGTFLFQEDSWQHVKLW